MNCGGCHTLLAPKLIKHNIRPRPVSASLGPVLPHTTLLFTSVLESFALPFAPFRTCKSRLPDINILSSSSFRTLLTTPNIYLPVKHPASWKLIDLYSRLSSSVIKHCHPLPTLFSRHFFTMPSFRTAFLAAAAVFVVTVQADYSIDPSSVPLSTRSEYTRCNSHRLPIWSDH